MDCATVVIGIGCQPSVLIFVAEGFRVFPAASMDDNVYLIHGT